MVPKGGLDPLSPVVLDLGLCGAVSSGRDAEGSVSRRAGKARD